MLHMPSTQNETLKIKIKIFFFPSQYAVLTLT